MDYMELIKTKQPAISVTRNKIYGNKIAKIKLNQKIDGRIFGVKNGEIVCIPDENTTETSFDTNFKRILFSKYFRVVEKIGNNLTVVCRSCELILNDSDSSCDKTRHHLRVCIGF